MIKLCKALKEQNMTPTLFSLGLDSPNRGKISTFSLVDHIGSLRMQFKEREKYSIVNRLDPTRTGELDERHLIRELEIGTEMLKDPSKARLVLETKEKKDPSKPRSLVEAEEAEEKRRAEVRAKVPGGRELSELGEANINGIMKRVSMKVPLSVFVLEAFDSCRIDKGNLNLEDFNDYLLKNLGTVLGEKERALLLKTIDGNGDGSVNTSEYRSVSLFYPVFQNIQRRLENTHGPLFEDLRKKTRQNENIYH